MRASVAFKATAFTYFATGAEREARPKPRLRYVATCVLDGVVEGDVGTGVAGVGEAVAVLGDVDGLPDPVTPSRWSGRPSEGGVFPSAVPIRPRETRPAVSSVTTIRRGHRCFTLLPLEGVVRWTLVHQSRSLCRSGTDMADRSVTSVTMTADTDTTGSTSQNGSATTESTTTGPWR